MKIVVCLLLVAGLGAQSDAPIKGEDLLAVVRRQGGDIGELQVTVAAKDRQIRELTVKLAAAEEKAKKCSPPAVEEKKR